MKPAYFIINPEATRMAVLDVVDLTDIRFSDPGYSDITHIVTRLNVPLEMRGKGFALELLRQVTIDADSENATLYLDAMPSTSEVDFTRLVGLYNRFGFELMPSSIIGMKRKPQLSQS